MTEQDQCAKCGSPLPGSVRGGLCPACLLKRGLETNTIGFTDEDQAEAARRWTPPTVEELAPIFPELDILELIGRGGMGAVYKAREKQLDRLVALKILPPEIGREPAFAQRFAREAQAMAKLSHSNIVTIHSFGRRSAGELAAGGELYFFIMEYVDGLSLRQLLDSGTVSPKEALTIVPQICDALQYAHDRGIVHRDIKPENILLNRAGQVKIADFGLAKLVGLTAAGPAATGAEAGSPGVCDVTQVGEKVMGTPQYMAPEQIERPREVDHRADIYSLGVVFYQMLTGELPKGFSSKEFEPPSRKVLIDVRLDEVVLRAMEREPSRRYQHVSEIRTQVETIVGSNANAPADQPKPEPPPLSPLDQQKIDRARQTVKAPAIGMIVAAGINLAILFSFLALVIIRTIGNAFPSEGGTRVVIEPIFVVATVLGIIANMMILLGAFRMMQLRNRGLAITAAILALIAVPGNIIGLPMGIWALVVLSRREIVEAFNPSESNKAIGKSRAVVWLLAAVALLAVTAACFWAYTLSERRSVLRKASLTHVEFHYRVFEADVALVDKLIPATIRTAVQPPPEFPFTNWHSSGSRTIGDFTVSTRGTKLTDAQMAAISSDTLKALLNGIGDNPGLLVDRTRLVSSSWWQPGMADSWSYSRANDTLLGSGGATSFLGFRHRDGQDQIRIANRIQHGIDLAERRRTANSQALIFYEGQIPQEGALAFLVPFIRSDDSPHYLVVAYEIGKAINMASPPVAPEKVVRKLYLPDGGQLDTGVVQTTPLPNEPVRQARENNDAFAALTPEKEILAGKLKTWVERFLAGETFTFDGTVVKTGDIWLIAGI